uniref:Uncharacterized protein n=1 Tax=Opuntia streptacantha TaxID=393608 RepID=A0A7C9CS46_OPUST
MPLRKPKKPPDPKSSHLPHQLLSCFPHIDLSDLPSPYFFYLPPPADVTRLAVIGDVCPRFLAAAEPVVVLASRSWWSYARSSTWPYQCLPSKPSCSRNLARYGLTLMGNDSLSNPRQVRTTYPLLVRDSLDLGDLISRFWWYGFVLVDYSILVTVCEYCVCRTAILWWLLSVRVVEALNGSVMCLLHACFPEFNLIASEIFFMASSSSSPPVSQSPQNVGQCSAEGSSSPLPRSHKPLSLSSGSYSEALALGGGGKDSKAAQSPRSLPPESHPQPHTASMHTLCLLGKLWGETIPLSVVISKTQKDWGFITMESIKKRKLEEGDVFSPSQPTNY